MCTDTMCNPQGGQSEASNWQRRVESQQQNREINPVGQSQHTDAAITTEGPVSLSFPLLKLMTNDWKKEMHSSLKFLDQSYCSVQKSTC